ncbi:MAG: hypothetical protein E6I52_16265 [Chloroflexi bacterium]|nr:MAG: hypothetical protein E6I52_16265 [Chloroflexota bacterium]
MLTSSDALDDPQGWSQRALTADAGTTGANVLQLAVGNPSPDERQQAQAFKQHTLQRSVGRVRPFALPANSYTWAWPTVGKATAFVGTQLWAPFAVVTCPKTTLIYKHLGWRITDEPIWCEQPGGPGEA